MWSYIPACLRRHRRKLFVIGGIVGGLAFLNSYLKKKFVDWESKRTAEIRDQFKRSSHFESMINTCDSAMVSFAQNIKKLVSGTVDVNPIVEQLKEKPPNKMQLWEQLKILVFTQAIGEMYAQCLFVVVLRVQMSILGGYAFINCSNMNTTSSNLLEQQQKYMSIIANFLNNGINKLLISIRKAVEDVLAPVPLNSPLKLQDVNHIIKQVRMNISSDSASELPDVSNYLMLSDPSNGDDEFFKQISSETNDILECKDFDQVLSACIDRGINHIMDKIALCFGMLSDAQGFFTNLSEFQVPLAKIIPIMHNVFSQHKPTEPGALNHLLLQLETLNVFSANIYESFSQIND